MPCVGGRRGQPSERQQRVPRGVVPNTTMSRRSLHRWIQSSHCKPWKLSLQCSRWILLAPWRITYAKLHTNRTQGSHAGINEGATKKEQRQGASFLPQAWDLPRYIQAWHLGQCWPLRGRRCWSRRRRNSIGIQSSSKQPESEGMLFEWHYFMVVPFNVVRVHWWSFMSLLVSLGMGLHLVSTLFIGCHVAVIRWWGSWFVFRFVWKQICDLIYFRLISGSFQAHLLKPPDRRRLEA